MTISFYDASVDAYLRTLGGVAHVLEKGKAYADAGHLDLDELVKYKLRDDMAPFSFQIISVWHHSLGAIKGFKAGLFEPPPKMSGMTFEKCRDLVAEATESLKAESPEDINALADQPMTFRMGGNDMPFTTTNFLLSFSLPNFYFHATTAYDVLRIHGVPLGKMDYLGNIKVGH